MQAKAAPVFSVKNDRRGRTPSSVQELARLLGTETVAAAVAAKAYFDLSIVDALYSATQAWPWQSLTQHPTNVEVTSNITETFILTRRLFQASKHDFGKHPWMLVGLLKHRQRD